MASRPNVRTFDEAFPEASSELDAIFAEDGPRLRQVAKFLKGTLSLRAIKSEWALKAVANNADITLLPLDMGSINGKALFTDRDLVYLANISIDLVSEWLDDGSVLYVNRGVERLRELLYSRGELTLLMLMQLTPDQQETIVLNGGFNTTETLHDLVYDSYQNYISILMQQRYINLEILDSFIRKNFLKYFKDLLIVNVKSYEDSDDSDDDTYRTDFSLASKWIKKKDGADPNFTIEKLVQYAISELVSTKVNPSNAADVLRYFREVSRNIQQDFSRGFSKILDYNRADDEYSPEVPVLEVCEMLKIILIDEAREPTINFKLYVTNGTIVREANANHQAFILAYMEKWSDHCTEVFKNTGPHDWDWFLYELRKLLGEPDSGKKSKALENIDIFLLKALTSGAQITGLAKYLKKLPFSADLFAKRATKRTVELFIKQWRNGKQFAASCRNAESILYKPWSEIRPQNRFKLRGTEWCFDVEELLSAIESNIKPTSGHSRWPSNPYTRENLTITQLEQVIEVGRNAGKRNTVNLLEKFLSLIRSNTVKTPDFFTEDRSRRYELTRKLREL